MNPKNSPFKIPFSQPYLSGEESRLVQDALVSTWVSDGPYVSSLEKEFSDLHGVPCAVSVCNGTAALELALRALGVGPGDEVIVPGFTFAAPFNMVWAVGAKAVYADVDAKTWCIDPVSIKSLIAQKTRAVIAVHLYGNVCNMTALRRLTKEHGLFLIEDCAHAVFSTSQGKYSGTFGDLGCFSFQATKTMTTGEGGMVIAADAKHEERLRLLRNHGMTSKKRYWHDVLGFNFRMTNLQAALGCAQLRKSAEIISKKRSILQGYQRQLQGIQGLQMQFFEKGVEPIAWSVGVRVDSKIFGCTRDELIRALSERGIETRTGFYPPSQMPLYSAPPLPVSEDLGRNLIVLPAYTAMTERQVNEVCLAIGESKK